MTYKSMPGTRVWIERRDRTDRVIERVGPFEKNSKDATYAQAGQMQIAWMHDRSREASDLGYQLVYVVEK